MKGTKRRLLALLLALTMVLGMFPMSATAAGGDLVMDTGHVSTNAGEIMLSNIVLKGTGGSVTGSGTKWSVTLPVDTDTSQPLTFKLTGNCFMAQILNNLYVRAESEGVGVNSTNKLGVENPGTVSITPQWSNGKATVTVGLGTKNNKFTGTQYIIEFALEGAAEDPNIIKLGETVESRYFVYRMMVDGATVESSSVRDKDFSGTDKGHKSTVDIELTEMPSDDLNLTLEFMNAGIIYIGESKEELTKGSYVAPIDLSKQTCYTFVIYPTSSSSAEAYSTYTVNFAVKGVDTNLAPVIVGSETSKDAEVQYPESYPINLRDLFWDGNNDALTYKVSINDEEPIAAEVNSDGVYRYTPIAAGDVKLVFYANDGKLDSAAYTVNLEVKANNAPVIKDDALSADTVSQYAEWSLVLSEVFTEPESGEMTYSVDLGAGIFKEISGSTYSLTPGKAGELTLKFKANDGYNDSDAHTVTLSVTEADAPANVAVIREAVASIGSFDFIKFTNPDGTDISDVSIARDGNIINVTLPRSVGTSGTVRASFGLTQEAYDDTTKTLLPFVSGNSNGSSGIAYKDTTLSNNQGTATVYFFPAVGGNATTYTINYALNNVSPTLKGASAKTDSATAGVAYTLKLTDIFEDPDGDNLSYRVSVNGGTATSATVDSEGNYTFTPAVGKDYTLVFTASDGLLTSDEYTLTLNADNASTTYNVTFYVPEGLTPSFYPTTGYDENGVDTFETSKELSKSTGTAANGFVPYTVAVPTNVDAVSFRDDIWGGMSITVTENKEITLEDFSGYINHKHDGSYVTAEQAIFRVRDNYGHYAVSGSSAVDNDVTYYRFLLAATGNDATYTLLANGLGNLADIYAETSLPTFALEPNGQTFAALELTVANALTITVPNGAVAKLYKQANNYNTTEIAAVLAEESGDNTVYTFKNPGGNITWRAYFPDDATKITKAGYIGNEKDITVTWDSSDPEPDTQGTWGTDSAMAQRYDASAVLNVNSQNHLVMAENGSFCLRGYRWWQIINHDSWNVMIEPDFYYNITAGNDVISIDAKNGGNGRGNWMDITATGKGMAVVEVGFDALAVSGLLYEDSSSFVYGACDPARTALAVISVGEDTADVDFGISCNSINVTGNVWDAEFNTLYFLGEQGSLKLSPDALGTLSVSHDKGKTWKTLAVTDGGYYVAPIVSGGNILKMETAEGVDYQVVRGDKITATLSGKVTAGETVTISLDGLHHNISKMSGIYNPGFGGGVSASYRVLKNGSVVGIASGKVDQYQIVRTLTFNVPDDAMLGDVFELTNGYLNAAGMGSSGGAHRAIADAGIGDNTGAGNSPYVQGNLPSLKITVGSDQLEVIEEPARTMMTVTVGAYDYTASDADISGASDTGVILEKTVEVSPDATAREIWEAAFTDSGVEYVISDTDLGAYISSINGLTASGYSGWYLGFYDAETGVFDDFTNLGLDTLTITDGDRIEAHYSVNKDGTTDDIGNGFYGLPIFTSFALDGTDKVTMDKSTSFEGDSAVTAYYEVSNNGNVAMNGNGTASDPFVISLTLKQGSSISNQKANFSASLHNKYYTITNISGQKIDLTQAQNYTTDQTVVLSTLGGTHKTYYKIKVTQVPEEDIPEVKEDKVTFRLVGSTLSENGADLSKGALEGFYGAEYVTWIATKEFTISKFDTVGSVLERAAAEAGLEVIGIKDNYVSTITAPDAVGGYSLVEFTNGSYSGWMYTVNGEHSRVGLSSKYLKNGDSVVFHYVNDYRYEVPDWYSGSLGNASVWNGWLKVADVNPSGSTPGGAPSSMPSDDEITVPISGDENTIHVGATVEGTKATIDEVDLTDLNKVVGDQVDTGTVTIDFSGLKNDKPITTVELPADTVKKIAEAVNDPKNDAHSLEIVLSDGASIEFDAAALKEKASQANGADITISIVDSDKAKLSSKQIQAVGKRPAYDINVTSGGKHISDMGGKITVHAPYELKSGEKARGIVVYYVDDNGNKERCETSYDPIKKRVNWKTDHLSLYMIDYDETLANNPFDDVAVDAYYYDAVLWAVKEGITSGTSDITFSPNNPCTRAQMVTFLWKASGSPEPMGSTCPFMDVRADAYYAKAVLWAVEQGITAGTSTTTFSPNASCTRGQMATFLYRDAKSPAVTGTHAFADVKADAYYNNAVIWAAAEGITAGTSDTTFSPDADCTRAQMVTFLWRYLAK